MLSQGDGYVHRMSSQPTNTLLFPTAILAQSASAEALVDNWISPPINSPFEERILPQINPDPLVPLLLYETKKEDEKYGTISVRVYSPDLI